MVTIAFLGGGEFVKKIVSATSRRVLALGSVTIVGSENVYDSNSKFFFIH